MANARETREARDPAPADSTPAPDQAAGASPSSDDAGAVPDDNAARAALDAALAAGSGSDDAPRGPGRPREYANDDERRAAAARRARERRAARKRADDGPDDGAADALRARIDAGAQVRDTRAALRSALDESEARRVALESEIARLRDAAQVRGSGVLATMLTTTFDVAFGIIATRRQQPAWMLERWEAEAMGSAWAEALAPYWSSIAPYAPIGMAAVVTWGALDPRLRVEAATLSVDDFRRMQEDRRRQLAALGAGEVAPVPSASSAPGAPDAVNDS